MSKRNYLNVVSAGVVAFGTLALGLVSVLPVANAANAAETPKPAVNDPAGAKPAVNDPAGAKPATVDPKTDPAAGQDEESYYAYGIEGEDFGHNKKASESDPLEGPQLSDIEDHDLSKYMGLGNQDDAKKEEGSEKGAEKTDPKADKGTDKKADQKTEQTKATEPAKDQQRVKKGHHKFGAPNTGYEF